MTRTVYYTATTLDGFLADEEDSLDWLLSQPQDKDGPLNYDDFRATLGAGCMGATTYEWILANDDEGWTWTLPLWVFTHRDLPPNDGVTFVQGDVREVHAAMAATAGPDKDVWVIGGGDLAAQFAEAGLLDRMLLSVAPVTLGAGRPLFPRRHDFQLTDVDRNGAFATLQYDVVGPRE